MMNKPQLGILLIWIVLAVADCAPPTAPSPIPPPAPPAPEPTRLQPTVTAITPNTSSTAGGAWGTITGMQFQSGAAVRLGDGGVQFVMVRDDATVMFWTTSHPAGTVDVVVTNPGGLSSRLTGGYTFAPPDSFDFNGDWVAHAGPDYETDMRFAIRNNVLVSLACGSSETVTLSPQPSIHGGEFSFLGDDRIAVSGRLVSPVNAVGMINVPGCIATEWWADKTATQNAGAR